MESNPDHVHQNIGPDQEPNCFDTDGRFLKEFFERLILKTKNKKNMPSKQRVNCVYGNQVPYKEGNQSVD